MTHGYGSRPHTGERQNSWWMFIRHTPETAMAIDQFFFPAVGAQASVGPTCGQLQKCRARAIWWILSFCLSVSSKSVLSFRMFSHICL